MIPSHPFGQLMFFASGSLLTNTVAFLIAVTIAEAGLPREIASGTGYIAGIGVSFLYHSRVTFKSSQHGSILKFLALYSGGFVFSIILANASRIFEYPFTVIQVVITVITGVMLFLGQKYWVFRS